MTTTQNPTKEHASLSRHFTGQDSLRNCGKAIAKVLGYEGRPGGWIYTRTGRALCQGYDELARKYAVRFVNHRESATGKAYYYLPENMVEKVIADAAYEDERQARREAADAAAEAKLAEIRERGPIVPTHAVVDTLHGHTFTQGSGGEFFNAETAKAFADHRNEALKPGIPGHIVVTLVPVG